MSLKEKTFTLYFTCVLILTILLFPIGNILAFQSTVGGNSTEPSNTLPDITSFSQILQTFQLFGINNVSQINQLFQLGTNATSDQVMALFGLNALTNIPGIGTVLDFTKALQNPLLTAIPGISSIPGIENIQGLFGTLNSYGVQGIDKILSTLNLSGVGSLNINDLFGKLGVTGTLDKFQNLPGLNSVMGFMQNSKVQSAMPFVGEGIGVFQLASALANGPFAPFGGKITKKSLEFCLIKVPPPIFVLPIPFYYFEVGPPAPAKLYRLLIPPFGTIYREYEFEETVNSLGNFVVGGSEAFRQLCTYNKAVLPKADGVMNKIGTSCKTNPGSEIDDCHRRVALIHLQKMAEYKILETAMLASIAAFPAQAQASFNPRDPKYAPYCDNYSPQGQCYEIGTCNPQLSQQGGTCVKD